MMFSRRALLPILLATAGCSESGGPTLPETPAASRLEVVSGADQRFPAGRRSPEPFRVRALDAGGLGVAGVRVTYRLTGTATGTLSQPTAVTDAEGIAETWLLDAGPGEGHVSAESGDVGVTLPITVERAPGAVRFEDGTGELGVPGLPHPDSVVSVVVTDTDGAPMDGVTVWFATSGTLSSLSDVTDASGRAQVVLRRTGLGAGSGTVFAFIVGFEDLTVSTRRPTASVAERVVLVSVDGLRADAVDVWSPPSLLSLASNGARVTARTVLPSLTVPAHLSMWSGVSPETHGVRNDTLRFTPQMTSLNPIFRRSRSSGLEAVAFVSEQGPLSGFGDLLSCREAFGLDSLYLVTADAGATVEASLPLLRAPESDLIFLHLPDPDSAGHAHGFTSTEYGAEVADVDAAIGALLDVLDLSTTLLVVTAPHGGGGSFGDRLHGSSDPADVEVPLLLYGAGVRPGATGTATILDVAPTVLWALGMAPPGQYEGRALLELFQP